LELDLKKRIVAQTTTGEVVGHLPTKYNYLAGCMKAGYKYAGTVRDSRNPPPIATVTADFVAIPPK
jgi:hypothetical protein